MKLKVKKLTENARLPHRAHPRDAGMDLCASHALTLAPGEAKRVHTGIAIELPAATEAQVRPRSGLAFKHAVTVLNAPGTIDEGYRGEVGVLLINHGSAPFAIAIGDKIAQMIVQPVLAVQVEEADTLSDTARAEGGFGSTGMNGTV